MILLQNFGGFMRKIFLILLLLFSFQLMFSKSVVISTEKDRTALFVTIYNSDRALICDERIVNVPKGEFVLKFMDVSEKIIPESVNFESNNLFLYEQNFEYDLLTPLKLLEKFVGREIEVIEKRVKDNSTEEVIKKAKILSVNNGVVYEIDGKIITGKSFSGYIFPNIPNNLISHPTLLWLLKGEKPGKENVKCSYLTGGMTWSSNYVLFLNSDEDKGALTGWITLRNESGTAYKNAVLKLVAGEVNVVKKGWSDKVYYEKAYRAAPRSMPVNQTSEKKFFEYHMYTVKRKVTLKNNQEKQISMLNVSEIKIRKTYEVSSYSSRFSNEKTKPDVYVYLNFKNSEENNLGIPLPAGVFRVYKEDNDGSPIFVGEDKIKHTPRDEDVKIKMGKAFDIKVEKVCTKKEKLAKGVYELDFKYVLKNHKDKGVEIEVKESFPDFTKIVSSNMKYEKISSNSVKFIVPVEKKSKNELTYKIIIKNK